MENFDRKIYNEVVQYDKRDKVRDKNLSETARCVSQPSSRLVDIELVENSMGRTNLCSRSYNFKTVLGCRGL